MFNKPSSQPLKTTGKVSQLGTLNFHQSMNAATIITRQITNRGHFSTVQSVPFMRASLSTEKKGERPGVPRSERVTDRTKKAAKPEAPRRVRGRGHPPDQLITFQRS